MVQTERAKRAGPSPLLGNSRAAAHIREVSDWRGWLAAGLRPLQAAEARGSAGAVHLSGRCREIWTTKMVTASFISRLSRAVDLLDHTEIPSASSSCKTASIKVSNCSFRFTVNSSLWYS
jgi:hypothetical protein